MKHLRALLFGSLAGTSGSIWPVPSVSAVELLVGLRASRYIGLGGAIEVTFQYVAVVAQLFRLQVFIQSTISEASKAATQSPAAKQHDKQSWLLDSALGPLLTTCACIQSDTTAQSEARTCRHATRLGTRLLGLTFSIIEIGSLRCCCCKLRDQTRTKRSA